MPRGHRYTYFTDIGVRSMSPIFDALYGEHCESCDFTGLAKFSLRKAGQLHIAKSDKRNVPSSCVFLCIPFNQLEKHRK